MLTLYVKTGCLYCAKVLETLEGLGVAFETKNVAEPEVMADLVARGGKSQVPYLVDAERRVEMYESEDIIRYLENYYTASAK